MKHFFKMPYMLTLAGILLGGVAGFLYWNFVGCTSGSCAITSVWYNSTMYGALMGGLLVNSFKPVKNNNSGNGNKPAEPKD